MLFIPVSNVLYFCFFKLYMFFTMAQNPPVGQGFLIIEGS